MNVYSENLDALIELEGWVSQDQNIILTHKSIDKYARRHEIDAHYDVIRSERDHAVVMCTVTCKSSDLPVARCLKATELGEVVKENLDNVFVYYPVMTAMEMAFDRAMIKLLMLPSNTYSVLEFRKFCESPLPAPQKGNSDYSKWVLSFGQFRQRNITVANLFDCAKRDNSTRATLKLYLSRKLEEIKNENERKDILAIQGYAKQINWK